MTKAKNIIIREKSTITASKVFKGIAIAIGVFASALTLMKMASASYTQYKQTGRFY